MSDSSEQKDEIRIIVEKTGAVACLQDEQVPSKSDQDLAGTAQPVTTSGGIVADEEQSTVKAIVEPVLVLNSQTETTESMERSKGVETVNHTARPGESGSESQHSADGVTAAHCAPSTSTINLVEGLPESAMVSIPETESKLPAQLDGDAAEANLVFTLDDTASVKQKIRDLPQKQTTMILAGMSFVFFAIWQVGGFVPSIALILFICGLILLTQFTRLSNKCRIEGKDNGLQISLVDAIGKTSLLIPKEKIQGVTQRKDAFELLIDSDFLSVPQKLLFRSLLKTTVDSSTKTADNLPATTAPKKMNVVRIPLQGLLSDSNRLLALLETFLPDGKSADKLVVAPSEHNPDQPVVISDGITRVDYNPNKIAKDVAAQWMRKNNWKVNLVLFFVGLAITLNIGISSTFVALMIAGLICFLAALHERERPTSIGFSADGIAFIWSRKSGETRSRTIPWSSVSHVSAFCSTGRKLFDTMIDIRLLPEKLPLAQRIIFEWMMPEYFANSPLKLRLRAGGLENADARHNLLHAFKKFLPDDRVENEVYKVLNPTDPESYTTLWLESLGNTTRRFSEGHLPPGYGLDNGRFEIVEMIGAGGQATAYLAKERWTEGETRKERAIVLKEFILPSHAGAELSARSLEHIRREHELIKRIHNSQVVEYYGLFVEDHRAYLILEHVDGPSLRQLVERKGPLSREHTLDLAAQMAEILCHLHAQSPPVVHRDFTPENLLLDKNGKLKLIDFNVAQELETTATRTIVGKHSYIPPEQFRGKPLPQSDIYAMGASLHFLLTGEEPEPISISHPILKRPDVGGDLDNLVARATRGDLSKRYATAQEVQTDIARILKSWSDSDSDQNEAVEDQGESKQASTTESGVVEE